MICHTKQQLQCESKNLRLYFNNVYKQHVSFSVSMICHTTQQLQGESKNLCLYFNNVYKQPSPSLSPWSVTQQLVSLFCSFHTHTDTNFQLDSRSEYLTTEIHWPDQTFLNVIHGNAQWHCASYQKLKKWVFKNPRWQTAAILKNSKLLYLCNQAKLIATKFCRRLLLCVRQQCKYHTRRG